VLIVLARLMTEMLELIEYFRKFRGMSRIIKRIIVYLWLELNRQD
jgi:hypothetical protein